MKKRFLSLIIALAMMVGVFTPLIANAAQAEGETETLTVHKILMTKEGLKNHDVNKKGYDGNKIKNIQDFFENEAKEIDGVYFKLQKLKAGVKKDKVDVNKDEQWEDVTGKAGLTGSQKDKNEKKLEGYTFDTKGLKGQFRIVEVHEKSTYKGDKGETLTDKKAVPSLVTLPLINDDGVVKNAHMYPKNTEEAPKIDKNFKKAEKGETELKKADGFNEAEDGAGIGVGAAYENYQKKKATAKAEIGKKIPYEVKTQIPAKSKLKTAYWSDEMTEGLKYNNDLKVQIGGADADPADYTVTTDKNTNGFRIELTQAGLEKVNGKDAPVEVKLTYSATVQSITVVDIPEANDITFHYGNNKPGQGNTPIPTKPGENGDLTVKKTWADGTPAAGEWASFKLVNAQTGEEIGTVKFETNKNGEQLETTTTYTPNATYEKIGNEKEIKGPETKTEKGNVWSFTWTGLDKELQYKVVEDNNMNQTAHFEKGQNGEILITNNKDNNPKPLNPTEPKVVTGGKKFVKTNQDGTERLAGAEFYIKNGTGKDAKYLVAAKKDAEAVETAKKALDDAVTAYNNLSAEEQKGDKGTTAKKLINDKQDAYNKAFVANATAYTWEDAPAEGKPDNRVVLTSDGQGRFEITGLAYGTYYLEEKTAPKGYAKRNDTPEFKVEKGSYSTVGVDFKYNEADTENSAKQIINKKVSIPQTGGIGTIIFTAIGLAIMASAVIAIKKRQATEAR